MLLHERRLSFIDINWWQKCEFGKVWYVNPMEVLQCPDILHFTSPSVKYYEYDSDRNIDVTMFI